MSKKLNTNQIRQELEGSAFFPTERVEEVSAPAEPTQDSQHASTLASKHKPVAAPFPLRAILAAIRKTVRVPGREVSFVRLSSEEKARLVDIVYTYKRQGHKTSETEINRIAVNFILEDYTANGEQSILAQALAALRE